MLSLALAAALAALPASGPVSTPVVVQSGPVALHGTLLTPDGPTRAAALILPGSGPTDRDGNNAMGLVPASYRLLAEGLADRGIATVRIDKRGIGESVVPDFNEADLTFDDYVADARDWAAEAVARTGQPCVWLIGHSEGALVALAAVRDGNDDVCGLILLSGAGRPAGRVLEEQLGPQLPEPLRTQAFHAIAELEAGRLVPDAPAALAALFRPSVQPYLISWLALDPAALAAAYDGPVLIGQGETDIQTSVVDARAMAEAQPRARLIVWPGVNHLLKLAPSDRAANIATYSNPDLPLAPGVVEDVAGFILEAR